MVSCCCCSGRPNRLLGKTSDCCLIKEGNWWARDTAEETERERETGHDKREILQGWGKWAEGRGRVCRGFSSPCSFFTSCYSLSGGEKPSRALTSVFVFTSMMDRSGSYEVLLNNVRASAHFWALILVRDLDPTPRFILCLTEDLQRCLNVKYMTWGLVCSMKWMKLLKLFYEFG